MTTKKYQLMGWFVCAIAAVFYAYEYVLRITPSVMETPVRLHFGLWATGFGLLSSAYYYAYVPMLLPVGVLLDRFGPRRLLTLACVACAVGTFMFVGTTSLSIATTGRFLVGFGSAFAFVGVLKLATIWLPEDKFALVAGLASALGTLGGVFADNALGALVASAGWQQTVISTGVSGIILCFVLWFCIHDHQKDNLSGGTISTFKNSMIDLVIILRNKQIWLVGAYGCLVYLPTTVFAELWGIPFLNHAHEFSQKEAQFANSLIFWGFAIGAPIMGMISDSLRRRILPMRVGAFIASLIMFYILYMPSLTHMSIYIALFCLGLFYSAQAIVFAVGREVSPDEAAGTAIAVTNMFVMLGAIFLQPLVGRLLDWQMLARTHGLVTDVAAAAQAYTLADYRVALSIIPTGIFLAAILTFFMKETHAQEPKHVTE